MATAPNTTTSPVPSKYNDGTNDIPIPWGDKRKCNTLFDSALTTTLSDDDVIPRWFIEEYPSRVVGLKDEHEAMLWKKHIEKDPNDRIKDIATEVGEDVQWGIFSKPKGRLHGRSGTQPFDWKTCQILSNADLRRTPRAESMMNSLRTQYPNGFPSAVDALLMPNAKGPPPRVIEVGNDRNYEAAYNYVWNQRPKRVILTGATSVGKSTILPLQVAQTSSSLFIVPNWVCAANMLHEHNTTIAKTIQAFQIRDVATKQLLEPQAMTFTDLQQYMDFDTPFVVTDAYCFLTYVIANRSYPPFEFIFMDEYHLPDAPTTWCREILMTLDSAYPTKFRQCICFISATPPGIKPTPPRVKGITLNQQPDDLPALNAEPMSVYYKTETWEPHKGALPYCILQVVAESSSMARRFKEIATAEGQVVHLLTEETGLAQAQEILQAPWHDCIFVTTPETTIAITLPITVLLNPGKRSEAVSDKNVIRKVTRPMGKSAVTQVRGRGGRIFHTTVVEGPEPMQELSEEPSQVILAESYILLTFLNGEQPTSKTYANVLRAYPKLGFLTQEQATQVIKRSMDSSLNDTSLLLELFSCNILGEVYEEFSGSAKGYAKHNATGMTMFKFPNGTAFAPYLSLLSNHDPTKNQNAAVVTAITNELRKQRAVDLNDLEAIKPSVLRNSHRYLEKIFNVLKEFETVGSHDSRPTGAMDTHASFRYMFGNQVGSFLESFPNNFKVTLEMKKRNDYARKIIYYDFSARPMKTAHFLYSAPRKYRTTLGMGNAIKGDLVSRDLVAALKDTVLSAILEDDPNLSVDLSQFADFQELSGNKWFKGLKFDA